MSAEETGESDDRSPTREDYLRATAEACGLSPDAAVAHLDQMLARNRDARVIEADICPSGGAHHWLLRPESDTHECAFCGAER